MRPTRTTDGWDSDYHSLDFKCKTEKIPRQDRIRTHSTIRTPLRTGLLAPKKFNRVLPCNAFTYTRTLSLHGACKASDLSCDEDIVSNYIF